MIENLSFEQLIMWCCKTPEDFLRREIKRVLKNKGFSIEEDDYISYRKNLHDPDHQLRNLLMIRGTPHVCLVAHTDVCRDHTAFNNNQLPKIPKPVLRGLGNKTVIQDEDCTVQVGGDDRVGVAIALWIALHSDNDIAILLTTDEEIGMCSANELSMEKVKDFDLLIEIDRGNKTEEIVTMINGLPLCSDLMAERLLAISIINDMPRREVDGRNTDVFAIKRNKMCKNAVNLTCGYYESYGDDGGEYIDLDEAKATADLVTKFIMY